MGEICINLFGQLAIFVDDHPLFIGPSLTKPLELFAYMLINRKRPQAREAIATLFWPDLDHTHAKKSLRKVLCTLQCFLADVVKKGLPPVLLIERDWIALNPALHLQLDVDIFEHAYGLAQEHIGSALDQQSAQILAAAVARYEGDLLTGLYADWCLYERARFENMYLELLHKLMVYAETCRAYEQAITYGLQILRYDRANERAYVDLMRLYYLSGNRSAALHQYANCVAALAKELGVKPRKSTEKLYQQICHDDLAAIQPGAVGMEREVGQQIKPLSRSHLQQARADLQRVLEQVQGDIERVERLLKEE